MSDLENNAQEKGTKKRPTTCAKRKKRMLPTVL